MAFLLLQTLGLGSVLSYLPTLKSPSTNEIPTKPSISTENGTTNVSFAREMFYVFTLGMTLYHLTHLLNSNHAYEDSIGGSYFSNSNSKRKSQRMQLFGDCYQIKGDYFVNKDGLLIFVRKWLPKDLSKVKGIVLIIHGVQEHSGLYSDIAEGLCQENYICYCMDNQGHGRSEGDRFFVKRFGDFVEDSCGLIQYLKRLHGNDIDLFVLGHSLGGVIGVFTAEKLQNDIKGLILSGPGIISGLDELKPAKRLLYRFAKSVGEYFPKLRLGSVEAKDCLKSLRMRTIMDNDPLRQVHATARLGSEILHSCQAATETAKTLKLPLLIVHGEEDMIIPIANSERYFQNVISQDKTLVRIKDGLHDGLFEDNGGETLPVIVQWLNNRASSSLTQMWTNTVTNTLTNVIKQGITQMKQ